MDSNIPPDDPRADQSPTQGVSDKESNVQFNTIVLPKAMILDARIPRDVIDDLNSYLDASIRIPGQKILRL